MKGTPLWAWIFGGTLLALAVATWFGMPTPALSQISPALPTLAGLVVLFGYLAVRWRKTRGLIPGPEVLMALGLAILLGGSMQRLGHDWAWVGDAVSVTSVGVGAVMMRMLSRRKAEGST